MIAENDTFEAAQMRAVRILNLATWASVPLIALSLFFTGAPPAHAMGLSVAFALAGQIAAMKPGPLARIGVGQALVGQAIAFTAAFQGHAWQLDTHMAFFAVLAALVSLADVRAILLAAGTIVVHHLSLSILFPALIYPSADLFGNVARTLLHGAIVAAETGALVAAIVVRKRLNAANLQRASELEFASQEAQRAAEAAEEAKHDAMMQKSAAEDALTRAEEAQATAAAEQSRALEMERTSREADAREAERRAAEHAEQQHVVEVLREAMQRLAGGDLSVEMSERFPDAYEDLRLGFNSAVAALQSAVGAAVTIGSDIHNEASAISTSANDLSRRTEHQAATLEETAAAMEELTLNIKSSTQLASQASDKASAASDTAREGQDVVGRAISAMGEIEASSDKIARITNVIDEIAFQTNLLALNAGVEAARAGDAGRGFAVVASEVRALAQRSSEAAREISALISSSEAQVRDGVTLVNQTGEALNAISSAVEAITDFVRQIASAAGEQSAAFSEINTSMGQLDRATQQNAAMFEESTAASHALTKLAHDLDAAMGAFSISGIHKADTTSDRTVSTPKASAA